MTNIIQKYCEGCFRETNEGIYVNFHRNIFATHLNNNSVSHYGEGRVYFKDGTAIRNDVTNGKLAFECDFKKSKSFYLCSPSCANNAAKFINQSYLSEEFENILLNSMSVIDLTKSQIYLYSARTVSVTKFPDGSTNEQYCKYCENIHPRQESFIFLEILENSININPPKVFNTDNKFDFAFECNGNFYYYKTKNKEFNPFDSFCTFACAANFAVKNNIVVILRSQLFPKKGLCFTPHSTELALALDLATKGFGPLYIVSINI